MATRRGCGVGGGGTRVLSRSGLGADLSSGTGNLLIDADSATSWRCAGAACGIATAITRIAPPRAPRDTSILINLTIPLV